MMTKQTKPPRSGETVSIQVPAQDGVSPKPAGIVKPSPPPPPPKKR